MTPLKTWFPHLGPMFRSYGIQMKITCFHMAAPSVFNRWSCGFSDQDQVSHHRGTSLFACSANQSVRRVLYM